VTPDIPKRLVRQFSLAKNVPERVCINLLENPNQGNGDEFAKCKKQPGALLQTAFGKT
jgi:hypothetical protein